jgi:hypothetical protein
MNFEMEQVEAEYNLISQSMVTGLEIQSKDED